MLLVGLHHVAEARVGERLREVSVRRHEAVVVKAWTQAGRAQTEGLALGTAGSAQHTLVLGCQVGAEQGLQQLQRQVCVTVSTDSQDDNLTTGLCACKHVWSHRTGNPIPIQALSAGTSLTLRGVTAVAAHCSVLEPKRPPRTLPHQETEDVG